MPLLTLKSSYWLASFMKNIAFLNKNCTVKLMGGFPVLVIDFYPTLEIKKIRDFYSIHIGNSCFQ